MSSPSDDVAVAETGEERRKHGEVAAWCGESECLAARKRMPARVWRTQHGSAFHRRPGCEALTHGLVLAEQYGKEATTPHQVPLADGHRQSRTRQNFARPPESGAAGAQDRVGDGDLLTIRADCRTGAGLGRLDDPAFAEDRGYLLGCPAVFQQIRPG